YPSQCWPTTVAEEKIRPHINEPVKANHKPTALVVNESASHLNIDILRQFDLTPRLACKIVIALCTDSNNTTTNHGHNSASATSLLSSTTFQRSEEIDLFADYCRKKMASMSEILQTFDDESFITDRIFRNTTYKLSNKHGANQPLPAFQRFWHFCLNMASTEKQGLHTVGKVFFSQVWKYNHEFQFNFIVNCIEHNLVAKLLTAPAGSSNQQQNGQLGQLVQFCDLLKCQPDFEAVPELTNWKFQKIYQLLIDFTRPGSLPNLQSNSICYGHVLETFRWPLQHCPDLCVLGLLCVSGQSSVAKSEILSMAIPSFLNASHPNAANILHSIWNHNSANAESNISVNTQQKQNATLSWSQQVLLQALCDHYMTSPPEEQQQRLSRILDVAQDIKTLFRLLDGTCYPFVIDLSCLASRREYLKLDKWLMDKYSENGENFIRAIVAFLHRRYLSVLVGSAKDSNASSLPSSGPSLPAETLAVILTFLQHFLPNNSGQHFEISQSIQKELFTLVGNSSLLLQRAPRQPPPGVVSAIMNDDNKYYNRAMDTAVTKPQQTLQAVHPLDLIHQQMQQQQQTTQQQFGGFVQLPSQSSSPHGQQQVQSSSVSSQPQQQQQQQQQQQSQPQLQQQQQQQSLTHNIIARTNDSAVGPLANPSLTPEIVQDKVFFIVNNLSFINLAQKVEEFREVIGTDETYHGWIAQYFSSKRAAIEQNFQPLYANFLYELKMPKLIDAITRETFRNIKNVLRNDKKADNISDRTLLKNLGQWLGLLTLARNKPILHVDLDLKGLLVEAYHKGNQELLYVVPFLAEILKTTQKSTIFKPNNPFVLGLLRALVELRQQPNLKLNLEFQVEVLFNTLGVDLNKLVGQSNILNDEKYYSRIESQLGGKQSGHHSMPKLMPAVPQQQGQKLTMNSQSQAQQVLQINMILPGPRSGSPISTPQITNLQSNSVSSITNPMNQPAIPTAGTLLTNPVTWISNFSYSEIDVTNTTSLVPLITIQSNMSIFTLNPALKNVIRPAMEVTISDWIPSILEKSLKVCLSTVESIIKKDFALDADENRMRMAAHYLIRHLVSYAAMINVRETDLLEKSLSEKIRLAFTSSTTATPPEDQIERAANIIAKDNVDLTSAFIIKTAIEKAVSDIDKLLQTEYDLRRAARAEGGQFCHQEALAYQTKLMPELIQIRAGPTPSQQMKIYEDLGQNVAGFKKPKTALMDILPPASSSSIATSPFNDNAPTSAIGNSALNNLTSASPLTSNSVNMVNQLFSSKILPSNQYANALANQFGPVHIPPFTAHLGSDHPSSAPTPHSAIATGGSDTGMLPQSGPFLDELLSELVPQFRQLGQSLTNIPSLSNNIAHIIQFLQVMRTTPLERTYKLLLSKILDSMYELVFEWNTTLPYASMCRGRELHILLIKALSETFNPVLTARHVTRHAWSRLITTFLDPKKSAAPEMFVDYLIQNNLTSAEIFDQQLVLYTESTVNPTVVIRFIHRFGRAFSDSTLPKTVDLLMTLKPLANPPLMLEIQSCLDTLQSGNRHTPRATLDQLLQYNDLSLTPVGTSNALQDLTSKANSSSQQQLLSNVSLSSLAIMSNHETAEGDPPGLLEKTDRLLSEWINIYQTSAHPSKMFPLFVQKMNKNGILRTDDLVTRFFRLSTEICVESCYRLLANQPQNVSMTPFELRTKCFNTLDAFTNLIVLLIKNSGSSSPTSGAPEPTAKINLLSKILSIIASVTIRDQEVRQTEFQHLPYYRILILLFIELTLVPTALGFPTQPAYNFDQIGPALDPFTETVQFQVLNEFCRVLRSLRPSKVPSFAFAWLDFLANRLFIEKCLNGKPGGSQKGWALYAQLLIDLIKFEAPFLRNVELPQSVDLLYKGTLKVFLVLLHDFPEFLCEYCYSLCDVIPCNAIQMRNLVLSAFPRKMRLPDPFTRNLKIDQLPEMSQPPKTGPIQASIFNSITFKDVLDTYLRTRTPVTFLNDLKACLRNPAATHLQQIGPPLASNESLNVPLLNALILYVGQSAIAAIAPRSISMSTVANTTHMDIFQHLAMTLDTEGRYLFLNALANQLRYPNSHTHYFSCALLYLFAEANSEQIQEQITRVLVERLIIMRPHPWGLLVTFIELIKNPMFKFWNHEFVRCAPEIENRRLSFAANCKLAIGFKMAPIESVVAPISTSTNQANKPKGRPSTRSIEEDDDEPVDQFEVEATTTMLATERAQSLDPDQPDNDNNTNSNNNNNNNNNTETIEQKHEKYLIVASRTLRAASQYQVTVSMLDVGSPSDVELELTGARDSNRERQIVKSLQIGGDETQTLAFDIPHDWPSAEYKLTVSGQSHNRKLKFSHELELTFVAKHFAMFIQTDKAIYKPQQTVHIRAIVLDGQLRPMEGVRVDMSVRDAKRNLVKQWRQLAVTRGLVSGELPLSDEPVLGTWSVHVQASNKPAAISSSSSARANNSANAPLRGGRTAHDNNDDDLEQLDDDVKNEAEKTFTVAEYVLPTFGVQVRVTPPYATYNESQVTCSVMATYTYGKPVDGELTLTVQPLVRYAYVQARPLSQYQYKARLERGVAEVSVNLVRDLRMDAHLDAFEREIELFALVEESLTGRKYNATHVMKIYDKPIKVELLKSAPSFKPGLEYMVVLKVAHQDDTPVDNDGPELMLGYGFQWSGVSAYRMVRPVNGIAELALPIPARRVVTEPADRWPVWRTPEPVALNLQAAYKGYVFPLESVQRAESPSNSFMQIALADPKLRRQLTTAPHRALASVNDTLQLVLRTTQQFNSTHPVRITCLSMGRGRVLTSETITSPSTSTAPLNEHNNNVSQHAISVRVTPLMAPKMRILCYYVRQDNAEIVADSVSLAVDGALRTPVRVNVAPTRQVAPGQQVDINVHTRPQALVGVLGIDQSVLLLKSGNDITKRDVMRELDAISSTSNVKQLSSSSTDDDASATGDNWTQEWALNSRSMFANSDLAVLTNSIIFNPPLSMHYIGYMYRSAAFARSNTLDSPQSMAMQMAPAKHELASYYNNDDNQQPPSEQSIYVRQHFADSLVFSSLDAGCLDNNQNDDDDTDDGDPRLYSADFVTTSLSSARVVEEVAGAGDIRLSKVVLDHPLDPPNVHIQRDPPNRIVIRSFFPETWLWLNTTAREDGVARIHTTVPDTITSWTISAFAIDTDTGLGVAERTAELSVFRPFFVKLNLPYSVIRGESVNIQAIVFNYSKRRQTATVTLDNLRAQFEFTEAANELDSEVHSRAARATRSVSVEPDSGASVSFLITPRALGDIDLQVTARSDAYGDAVLHKLRVKPEGQTQYFNRALLISLPATTTQRNRDAPEVVTHNISVPVPSNAVAGSQRVTLSVVGDVLGVGLEHTEHLLRIPYGCGEQNMINLVPNIVVHQYLQQGRRARSAEQRQRAVRNIETGYQRQLTFKRPDGSFSAFGAQDSAGSTWLTAYVLKSLQQARPIITVDERVLRQARAYLQRQQRSDGSFVERGMVHDTHLLSAAALSEASVTPITNTSASNSADSVQSRVRGPYLTAYCLIALLSGGEQLSSRVNNQSVAADDQQDIKNMVARASAYLAALDTDDAYDVAIVAYALELARHADADKWFERLQRLARSTNEHTWWQSGAAKTVDTFEQRAKLQLLEQQANNKTTTSTERPPRLKPNVGVTQPHSEHMFVPDSREIEMTAFALLTHVERGQLSEALPIVRWLIAQQNSNGGFASTQDTVLAIEALAKFAMVSHQHQHETHERQVLDIDFSWPTSGGGATGSGFNSTGSIESGQLLVKASNRLTYQEQRLHDNATWVAVRASGSGTAVLQVSYQYNLQVSAEEPAFYLNPLLDKTSTSAHIELSICTYYKGGSNKGAAQQRPTSNMALMEVQLPSGYTADVDALPGGTRHERIKRVDTSQGDTHVQVYFDSLSRDEVCVTVPAHRTAKVANGQRVPVTIYDYYDRQQAARVFYEPLASTTCDICEGTDCGNSCGPRKRSLDAHFSAAPINSKLRATASDSEHQQHSAASTILLAPATSMSLKLDENKVQVDGLTNYDERADETLTRSGNNSGRSVSGINDNKIAKY
ncbi:CCR4-NOT transcription complex subunit 1, partial [Fragariocoptes setiger]